MTVKRYNETNDGSGWNRIQGINAEIIYRCGCFESFKDLPAMAQLLREVYGEGAFTLSNDKVDANVWIKIIIYPDGKMEYCHPDGRDGRKLHTIPSSN